MGLTQKNTVQDYGNFVHYSNSAVLFSSHSAFPGNRENTAVFAVVFEHVYWLHLFKRSGGGQRLLTPLVPSCLLWKWARGRAAEPCYLWELLHATAPQVSSLFFSPEMSAAIVPVSLCCLWNWEMCPGLRSRAAGVSLRTGAVGLKAANPFHMLRDRQCQNQVLRVSVFLRKLLEE